jgi:hypothetical protein
LASLLAGANEVDGIYAIVAAVIIMLVVARPR